MESFLQPIFPISNFENDDSKYILQRVCMIYIMVHGVTVPGASDIISGVCVVCSVASVRVMEQLSGHFTTNCCGCPDRGLMIRRWIKIILMSLLIRKNSK